MTKQEELEREVARMVIKEQTGTYCICDRCKKHTDNFVKKLMSLLARRGCGFIMEGELPKVLYWEEEGLDPKWVAEATQQDMLQAGYKLVLPIEDV